MDEQEDLRSRLAAAKELAPSLVGLSRDDALVAAIARGYVRTKVLSMDVQAVDASLDAYQLRLFVDDDDVVVQVMWG